VHVPLTWGVLRCQSNMKGSSSGVENQLCLLTNLPARRTLGYGVVARQDIAVGPIRGQRNRKSSAACTRVRASAARSDFRQPPGRSPAVARAGCARLFDRRLTRTPHATAQSMAYQQADKYQTAVQQVGDVQGLQRSTQSGPRPRRKKSDRGRR